MLTQQEMTAAIEATYPVPIIQHSSVMQRALENRVAFTEGWSQAVKAMDSWTVRSWYVPGIGAYFVSERTVPEQFKASAVPLWAPPTAVYPVVERMVPTVSEFRLPAPECLGGDEAFGDRVYGFTGAQMQEAFDMGLSARVTHQDVQRPEPAQAEPVAEIGHGYNGCFQAVRFYKVARLPIGTKLYTAPAGSRTSASSLVADGCSND